MLSNGSGNKLFSTRGKLILGMLVLVGLLLQAGATNAVAVTTPLEQSGLPPVWQENFTDGSIDRMQYTWSKGNNSALTSFVMPGAVYLGKSGGTIQIEQEINNFKIPTDTLLPATIEFDVLSPISGKGRVSLRPRRRGDMVTFLLGLANDKTVVSFRQDAVDVPYAEPTGPSYGWTHVVLSYRQFVQNGTTYAHFVVAVNNEIKEHEAPSGITNPDWATNWNSDPNADSWSIEHNSTDVMMGKYIANVRGYSQYLSLQDMQSRLQGRVSPYLSSLSDPRNYSGPKKVFQSHKTLVTHGPNAMAYASPVDGLTYRFDGSLSSDWDKITAYRWNFGDGTTGSGRLINHTYASPGTYSVSLSVTSESGTNTHTISVSVGSTPPGTTVPPTPTPINTPTATPTGAPPAGNLIVNPGFELDSNNDGLPDAWTTWANFTRHTDVVHGGSFSGRFLSTANDGTTIRQRVTNLAAGKTYNVSGWVNIPPTADAFTFSIRVTWVDSAGNNINTSAIKTYTGATNGWDQASAALVAPPGTTKANIKLVVSSLNATIYVDDFSFGP